MKDSQDQSVPGKIGTGHAAAMARSGLKELSSILAAFPEGVQPIEEYGLVGTKLPSEIADSKKSAQLEPDLNIEMEM